MSTNDEENSEARINWEIVSSNLAEAKEELDELVAGKAPEGTTRDVWFQIALQHIYHHLNFAWNVRHESTEKYANLTDEDFERWGRFPEDLKFEEED